MTTACPRAPCDEKNRGTKQQTDPRGEDKKEKQQNEIYFGLKHNLSRIEYTLGW